MCVRAGEGPGKLARPSRFNLDEEEEEEAKAHLIQVDSNSAQRLMDARAYERSLPQSGKIKCPLLQIA